MTASRLPRAPVTYEDLQAIDALSDTKYCTISHDRLIAHPVNSPGDQPHTYAIDSFGLVADMAMKYAAGQDISGSEKMRAAARLTGQIHDVYKLGGVTYKPTAHTNIDLMGAFSTASDLILAFNTNRAELVIVPTRDQIPGAMLKSVARWLQNNR